MSSVCKFIFWFFLILWIVMLGIPYGLGIVEAYGQEGKFAFIILTLLAMWIVGSRKKKGRKGQKGQIGFFRMFIGISLFLAGVALL